MVPSYRGWLHASHKVGGPKLERKEAAMAGQLPKTAWTKMETIHRCNHYLSPLSNPTVILPPKMITHAFPDEKDSFLELASLLKQQWNPCYHLDQLGCQ